MNISAQQITALELAPRTIEAIWRVGGSYLDVDPATEAVVVIRHRSLGFLLSGTYSSIAGAHRGIKRHGAKNYAVAAYIVTRARGESFEIVGLS